MSEAPQLDLALVAHEISDTIQNMLEQYGAKLVLCRERGACTLQVQFDGEHHRALTLIEARNVGTFRFVPIGKDYDGEDKLPAWLDKEAWQDWVAYRAEIRKPLTGRMRKAQFEMLKKQHDMGLSQRACIQQSITNGWVGLFPARRTENVVRGATQIDAFVEGRP
jgi:hypothetical protein